MKFIPSPTSIASFFRSAKTYVIAHKIISAILIVAILGTIYIGYTKATKAATPTRYVVETVRKGSVASVVSGSGQISASNQVDLVPKTSGEITSIRVLTGQHVYKGQFIASVDVGSSGTDLQTAELQLKQAQTSNSTSLTSSSQSVSKAQSDLVSARESALNTLTSSFGSLDQVIVDLGDLYNSSGYLRSNAGDDTLRADQNASSAAFADAQAALKSAESQTSSITRASSDTAIQSALTTAYTAAKSVANAASLAQTTVQYARTQKDSSTLNSQTAGNTAWSTVTSDVSSSNSQVTSLLSASQTITNDQNAISNANTQVTDVSSGSGALDIRSAELNVQAKQQAYNDHFVTAPFDGVIAQVAGKVGSQASSGTGIATLITTQELADITLNEVDVASVKVGESVTLTFDALSDLTITGTVAEVDGIGTVSSGVVSYAVKIALEEQDARIKPGMTVNADIQTASAKDVIVIPSTAIKTLNGKSFIQVFSPALPAPANPMLAAAGITTTEHPTRVAVQIGITDGTKTEITSGLQEGQQILIRTITGTTAATTGITATKTTAASATTRTGGGFGGGNAGFAGAGAPRGL